MGSWITDNLVGIGEIAGGAAATYFGAPQFGVPLMGAGASTLGGNQTNARNIQEAQRAQGADQNFAREQMAYQTQMSNTAYQRSSADMKAAGINPMLAGINQAPASTPQGAKGSGKAAILENAVGKGLSTATDLSNSMTAIRSQGSQETLNRALGVKALQDAKTSGASAKQMETLTAATQSQLKAIAAEAGDREVQAQISKKAAYYDAMMQRINRESGTAKNAMSMFRDMGNGSAIYKDKNNNFRVDKDTFIGNKNTGEIYNP